MTEFDYHKLQFRGIEYQFACSKNAQDLPLKDASYASFFDETEVRDQIWHVVKGDVVVDVGACYGSYTLASLSQNIEHVYSWVPLGFELEKLKESLRANGWLGKCTVYPTGVFSRPGWLDLDTQVFNNIQFENSTRVDSLDNWYRNDFKHHNNKLWLKIDVEGAEVDVLKGGLEFITQIKPNIFVENHLFKRASIAQEVRDILLPLNIYDESFYRHSDYNVSHALYTAR